jgi:hypothetical protein
VLNTFGREHEERSVTQSNFDLPFPALSFALSFTLSFTLRSQGVVGERVAAANRRQSPPIYDAETRANADLVMG